MKRLALFFAVFLLGGQVLSPVFASELTDDYFDIATNYFNSNNCAKALEYLDIIIQIEPDNLAAETLKNKLAPPIVENSKTVEEAPIVLAPAPNPPNFVVLDVAKADVEKMATEPGCCYAKQRRLLDLKRAVWLNKKDYLANFHLGEYYQYHGRFNDAITRYKNVVKINSKYPHVYLSLAECFFETKDFNYCLQALNQYKEFCPDADSEFILYLKTRAYSSSNPPDNSNLNSVINSLDYAISKYPDAKVFYLVKLKIYEAIVDNLNYNKTMDLIKERFDK